MPSARVRIITPDACCNAVGAVETVETRMYADGGGRGSHCDRERGGLGIIHSRAETDFIPVLKHRPDCAHVFAMRCRHVVSSLHVIHTTQVES